MRASIAHEKIRRLEIVTKKLMDGPLVGDDLSAHRGYGVELDQLREYQFGDDVRFIDFKSSCRLNKMMVKECLEERNRKIIIALDISSSSDYGSHVQRFEIMQDCAAILTLAAHHARDSVGLLFFSDILECTIEPANTVRHVHWLLKKIYETPVGVHKKTDMNVLLQHVARNWYKDAIVFVISDFIVDDIKQSLRATGSRVDLVAVRCFDEMERVLPRVGYITLDDIEDSQNVLINMSTNTSAARAVQTRLDTQNELFACEGIDVVDIAYSTDICAKLIDFFKRRMIHTTIRYG